MVEVDKERRSRLADHDRARHEETRATRTSQRRQAGRAGSGPRGAKRSASTDRKPRGKGAPRGKGRRPERYTYKPKAPPKPVVPITEKMKAGAEPMRTFGDLAQFFETKGDADNTDKKDST